jgi:hypothetical protein
LASAIKLSAHEPIEVWVKQAGMDWQICEAPVRFVTDTAGGMGAIESLPENKVLFRSDTELAAVRREPTLQGGTAQ